MPLNKDTYFVVGNRHRKVQESQLFFWSENLKVKASENREVATELVLQRASLCPPGQPETMACFRLQTAVMEWAGPMDEKQRWPLLTYTHACKTNDQCGGIAPPGCHPNGFLHKVQSDSLGLLRKSHYLWVSVHQSALLVF